MPQHYDIGKIRADNVAIGDRARIQSVTYSDAKQAAMQAEALYEIRRLIELLSVHADEIESAPAVQADVESVAAALRKKDLNRARTENLIAKIIPAVAGVTVLANATDAVQTAVSQLFT